MTIDMKEQCWKLHPELHPKRRRKSEDDDSQKEKKEEKTVLNAMKVEELFEFEQANFKLSLMVRKLKTTIEADLDVCVELFCLKIQMK